MSSLPELLKTTGQNFANIKTRPFDRFIIGPFMVWYGLQSKSMNRWPRRILVAGGLYQILYAIKDYQRLIEASKQGPTDILNVLKNQELDL